MVFRFVKTTDIETKDKLLNNGFDLISDNGEEYFFLFNSLLKFDENIETNKIQYTNILNV
jgi:hypothetical protein